jgi:hypothetical protein
MHMCLLLSGRAQWLLLSCPDTNGQLLPNVTIIGAECTTNSCIRSESRPPVNGGSQAQATTSPYTLVETRPTCFIDFGTKYCPRPGE